MSPADDLATVRRYYAEEICFPIRPARPRLIAAFSSVPREQFLGVGPWRAQNHQSAPDYWTTATGNAREVYHDVAFALDEAQGLNNGPPGLYALLLSHLEVGLGESVQHHGCGSGYYTAVLAELAGPSGNVTATELDAARAEQARAALAKQWPQVRVLHTDGAAESFIEPADVILVSAGASHPLQPWRASLKTGGRLIFSMATYEGFGGAMSGAALLITRLGETSFGARFLYTVNSIEFSGGHDPEIGWRFALAFAEDQGTSVKSLRIDAHAEDETCWLHNSEDPAHPFCLSRLPPVPHDHHRPAL